MATCSDEIDCARRLIAAAPRIVVLTGAGISAESGVPTFRGAEGLWQRYRPEQLASPEAFADDPRLVWEWYGWRRTRVAACQPNAAHLALARFALAHGKTLIVTQNVDGLHADAALAAAGDVDPGPALPIELHGNMFSVRCTACQRVWRDTAAVDASSRDTLPTCPECRALARPHVVWYGESLDGAQISHALCQAELAAACVVIGTSGVVQPAASIAAVTAQAGGEVIEINPDETPLTALCSVSIRSGAVAAVPDIFDLGSEPAEGRVQ
ncbi:MAG: NAD-dependent protein deacylase [Deltaproteobacteria bacterium]|nr:NAD-dependent protein deacylase [Deltaproteobacteria bacterium]